tara:strand:- start:1551 stop:1748 length:198 start_codon:yes stop_codon:yes gene_type:complete
MNTLNLQPNFTDGDEFYERLLNAHEGLIKEESDALNARLIILLANHIGDLNVLDQAIILAKGKGS